MKILLFLFCVSSINYAQIKFDDYFLHKTLRIDYYHTGDSINDYYSIDELKEEPFWGGTTKNLIDPFDYGEYEVKVYDDSTQNLIYSHTYSTLFHEWQTTEEAKNIVKSFSETVVMPFPKKNVRVIFFSRDKENRLIKKFEYKINPENYFISTESNYRFNNFKVVYNGNPEKKVDLVIIPEGYTEAEMSKFREDCKKFSGYLFNSSPYKENKEKFNVWGIEAPSKESGTDIPAKKIWKKTLLKTHFYTFDEERYLMTEDNKTVRDVAANAPYDQIYILVNSNIYGGGAIYNLYSVCVNNNPYEEYVFTHEFGHGFAFLGDEYYTSEVPYENIYPPGIEPLEPNLTTLINFDAKWKDLVDASTPIPTPATKEFSDVVGAFEGGGYVAKGVYRPMEDCTMKSATINNFCKVCKRSIIKMIDFYTE